MQGEGNSRPPGRLTRFHEKGLQNIAPTANCQIREIYTSCFRLRRDMLVYMVQFAFYLRRVLLFLV